MKCAYCHQNRRGGTSFGNKGPYGKSDEWKFACWVCWQDESTGAQAEARRGRERGLAEHVEKGLCAFERAWAGYCTESPVADSAYCMKHAATKCWKCGEQAVRECTETGALVCGVAECDEHPHMEVHELRYKERQRAREKMRCPECGTLPGEVRR